MSLLEVRDLSISFGARQVVDNVSFSLDAGEKLALVGESASGKTVTALSTLRPGRERAPDRGDSPSTGSRS